MGILNLEECRSVCVFELENNFSSACFSVLLTVWKSNIGCPSLSQSFCCLSSHHLLARLCLTQSVSLFLYYGNRWPVWCILWVCMHVCVVCTVSVIRLLCDCETFKLIRYHHQTESLRGGFLEAQCQFPVFLGRYLSTFSLILQDSTENPTGRKNSKDKVWHNVLEMFH